MVFGPNDILCICAIDSGLHKLHSGVRKPTGAHLAQIGIMMVGVWSESREICALVILWCNAELG